MKILILTQYFPPETGAPQNRLFSLAKHLKKLGAEVTVLTAMPNYPNMEVQQGYEGKWYIKEHLDDILIHRSWVFVYKSKNILPRLLNYFSFVFSSIFTALFRIEKNDIIICESPPLFLGISAIVIRFFKRSKVIFNVSDLWPETAEKLDIVQNKSLLSLSYKLEKYIYHKSFLVIGQTKGIVNNINKRYPLIKTYWLPNGIDFESYTINDSNFRQENNLEKDDFILFYAGILGHAQGLEVILHAANLLRSNSKIKFFIAGDGPVKSQLVQLKEENNLTAVYFLPNSNRNTILSIINQIDAYIVPLKKNDLFLGAIPSKLFEPLALHKPILLGVSGEAKELFIDQGNSGVHFEPENFNELAEAIELLYSNIELAQKKGNDGYEYVKNKFDRKNIALAFWNFLKTEL